MKLNGFIKNLLGLALALTAATSVMAETVRFKSHRTDVNLSVDFLGALTTLGVAPSAVKPAKIISTQARFPIVAGELDLSSAGSEIIHSGGLQLSTADVTVQLTNFIIDTTSTPVLTGLVKANGSIVGRVDLFNLELPSLQLPIAKKRKITIPNVGVKLTATAAATLNSVFGVTAFTEGFSIGVAHVIIRR